ncbi:YggT family protein [Niallia taxi]|uniref:YggT family protein n=1 Tax=Niallia taxi TaxID=2499688 RepID=A0A437KGI7_9BACI|nr:YggT family protein [Niallia taxi]MDK8638726.1 YggT family protein [Niallia taxi]MED4037735.1 YggT family protein [Niallia taxi]MED4053652.1 YggT family protein [Niallia taxi]MED4119492.1 YggT family protein [Niallia taxi]RVT67175.1 YggT family protein [Niallia taxi]
MDLILVIVSRLITFYSYALIIYIFMSWIPNARETWIGTFLARICEPYLEQFRKIIPPIGMIDISPIVAIFVLNLARMGVFQIFSWV